MFLLFIFVCKISYHPHTIFHWPIRQSPTCFVVVVYKNPYLYSKLFQWTSCLTHILPALLPPIQTTPASQQSVHSRQCRSLRGVHQGRALLALPFVPAIKQTARQLMFGWIGGYNYFDWAFIAIVTQWGLTGGPGEPSGPFSPCRNTHSCVNCTEQKRSINFFFLTFLDNDKVDLFCNRTTWDYSIRPTFWSIQSTSVLKHKQKLGILNAKRVIFHKYIYKIEMSL